MCYYLPSTSPTSDSFTVFGKNPSDFTQDSEEPWRIARQSEVFDLLMTGLLW